MGCQKLTYQYQNLKLIWSKKASKNQQKFGHSFGMLMPGRQSSSESYRYGFQGQERDDEIKGNGNSLNYKYRMHDPRLGRFFAVDPLAAKYPYNGPYNFSENRVIDAIELEGLEAYFIHGTNSSPSVWTDNQKTVNILIGLTNSSTPFYFDWSDIAPFRNNAYNHRQTAAQRLAKMVISTHVKGEDITLIAHSHGGNVAIQAAKIIYEATGQMVNLITISTPAYNSNGTTELGDKIENTEDPSQTNNGIYEHFHLYNTYDNIQVMGAKAFGHVETTPERTYTGGNTINYKIDVSQYFTKIPYFGSIAAHSFLFSAPESITDANIPHLLPVPRILGYTNESLGISVSPEYYHSTIKGTNDDEGYKPTYGFKNQE